MKASIIRFFAAFGIGVALFNTARAESIPFNADDFLVDVVVDGQSYHVPVQVIEGTDRRSYEGIFEHDVGGNGFRVTISGVLDPDPIITWVDTFTNFGTPSTFSGFKVMPIFPTGNPGTVFGQVTGGLTDATGNGVSLTPTGSLGDPDGDSVPEFVINDVGVGGPPVYTNMGVDVGSALTFGPDIPGAHHTFTFSSGPFAAPPGVWTTLRSTWSFTLSGDGDTVALTGFASIVPEPSSVALGVIGAASLFVAAMRRRRKA
jgi:hypothetical protein